MKRSVISGGKATSIPVGLIWGTVSSMIVTVILSALIAWLVSSERMQYESIGYGVMILLLLASFSGAYIAFRKIKHRKMLVSILSGAAYFVLLLVVTALFFGGQYTAVGETALMILCGSLLFGLTNIRKKPGKQWKIR